MDSDSHGKTPNENPNNTGSKPRAKSSWKKAEIVAVFGIIEVVSLVLWQKADEFEGFSGKLIHWISECGFLAGGAYLAYKFSKKHLLVWGSFALACGVLYCTMPKNPEINLLLSMQLGESSESTVFLTNDYLLLRQIIDRGSLSNGAKLFEGFVPGWLVIPVSQAESNKVFTLTIENDSGLQIRDLETVVGFPVTWECRVDPNKWSKMEASLIFARANEAWKWSPTNMQYFVAKSPWEMFPFDSLTFPAITNPCTNGRFHDGVQGGFMEIIVRCTGYEQILAVNVVFAPISSNFSKPFIVRADRGQDGSVSIFPNKE